VASEPIDPHRHDQAWRLRRHLVARLWGDDHVKARIAERGVLRTIVPLIYATFLPSLS